MTMRRLFVGGLSEAVKKTSLERKLSPYGTIQDVELKERTDTEGNVIMKFAYVNLEASQAQVEQCVGQLSGSSWKGSVIRVEPAKESFLDRLKRERAAQHPGQHHHPEPTQRQPPPTAGVEGSEGHRAWKGPQESSDNSSSSKDQKGRKKHEERLNSGYDNNSSKRLKSEAKFNDDSKIMSSFKSFSSVWADSDEEPDRAAGAVPSDKTEVEGGESDATMEDGEDDQHNSTTVQEEQRAQLHILEGLDGSASFSSKIKEQQQARPITRYDPTLSHHQQYRIQPPPDKPVGTSSAEQGEKEAGTKFVRVSQNLNFGQQSAGFSFLAQFSQQTKKVAEESDTEQEKLPPVKPLKSYVASQRRAQRKPFFVEASDPMIQDAITWMAQVLTEEVKQEYSEVWPELKDLLKTRGARARKEEETDQRQRAQRSRGRGRGRGRGQGRGRTHLRDGLVRSNPNKDHRWRVREQST